MFSLCSFWKRSAPADPARGGQAEPGEAYGDALLAGWVPPPEGAAQAAKAAPEAVPAQAVPADDTVLERFYRNQA